MAKSFIVLAAVCGILYAVSDSEWVVFKAKHHKSYGEREDFIRRMIYQDNVQKIKAHNEKYARGESTFYLEENSFADLTDSEFVKTMNGLHIDSPYKLVNKPLNTSLPTTVDWRKKGYVTAVKNQGGCGSRWAFSATGSLEGQHFKKTGKLVSLSESNLVDCSCVTGHNGCHGGRAAHAFEYVISNKGIDTELSYPYIPKYENCTFKRSGVGATISSYKKVEHGSESDLQEAVATIGPISVSIDAGHKTFRFYKSGVYDEKNCSSTKLDHGVLAVGYGVYNGTDYWLVKNSWGANWGDEGYIKMSRNKNNQCGIATNAIYPIV